MNRRGLFSLAGGAAALLVASRVKAAPAPVAPVEYDLGGPHAWESASYDGHTHTAGSVTDPCHTHELSTMEMPSHTHSISWMHGGRMHYAQFLPVTH